MSVTKSAFVVCLLFTIREELVIIWGMRRDGVVYIMHEGEDMGTLFVYG